MDKPSLSVFTLFTFLVPVSCIEGFFAEPVICYFLDGILIFYCVVATVLFFREKFPRKPYVAVGESVENGIYQELERPKDADPYEVLEPTKRKKKAANKKKSEVRGDLYSLTNMVVKFFFKKKIKHLGYDQNKRKQIGITGYD
ncbi:hypothetical protein INR49_030336 [Caranx melampygus]|nr:hypothetical protein INR49_030336 [Caranx melampygus]